MYITKFIVIILLYIILTIYTINKIINYHNKFPYKNYPYNYKNTLLSIWINITGLLISLLLYYFWNNTRL